MDFTDRLIFDILIHIEMPTPFQNQGGGSYHIIPKTLEYITTFDGMCDRRFSSRNTTTGLPLLYQTVFLSLEEKILLEELHSFVLLLITQKQSNECYCYVLTPQSLIDIVITVDYRRRVEV
ncbi:hypothetical protein Ocin01_02374 [Orchesella cincta]|uniref:Uncharacterized protein n=1 Tax=Orchesella cincta TaxID=48709 RepID=A0A1D2NGD0_ORCCI|nr:hypothetical protein Ocin01_02374 [Orchesella cincta]